MQKRLRRRYLLAGAFLLLVLAIPTVRQIINRVGNTAADRKTTSADGASGSGAQGRTSPTPTSTAAGAGKAAKTYSPRPTLTPSIAIPYDSAFGTFTSDGGADYPHPAGCDLRRGVLCSVSMHGRYILTNYEGAIIKVGAFENDTDVPVVSAQISILKGSSVFFQNLAYTPSSTAVTVRFRTILLTTDGRFIFERSPLPPSIEVAP
ncbi:MAG TPA: hypothetical protein VI541_02095 [Actinomycetota bacterium]|nr:hypothetical protein [Actinomycetota bacterium]